MRPAFLVSLVLLAFALAGRLHAYEDTFTGKGILRGSTMTKSDCVWKESSVWVVVDGRGDCLRYFAAGLNGSDTRRAIVWFDGDHYGAARTAQTRAVSSPKIILTHARHFHKVFDVPFIRLSRPGILGSSGRHTERRRPREIWLVNAALEALKGKYGIQEFVVGGQSGGGHLTAAMLTVRKDILCAISASGALSLQERWEHRDLTVDTTGYGDSWDPIKHIASIPANDRRRVFIIGDPEDRNVPFFTQSNYYHEIKNHGHKVWLVEAQASGRGRHSLSNVGKSAAAACAKGWSTEEIIALADPGDPRLRHAGRVYSPGDSRRYKGTWKGNYRSGRGVEMRIGDSLHPGILHVEFRVKRTENRKRWRDRTIGIISDNGFAIHLKSGAVVHFANGRHKTLHGVWQKGDRRFPMNLRKASEQVR
ncbi:MAG: alpha/beta hydrolase family protein [Methyloligellaceae bacterium]